MTEHTAPANTWAESLRSAGRRVTKQRLAVLAAVEQSPHSTADDVVTAVRAELADITVQSRDEPHETIVDDIVAALPKLLEQSTGGET